jgi:hypothetical protein
MVAPSSGSGSVKKAPAPKPAPPKPATPKPAPAPAPKAPVKKPEAAKPVAKAPSPAPTPTGNNAATANKAPDNKTLPAKNPVAGVKEKINPSPLDQQGRNQVALQNAAKPSQNAVKSLENTTAAKNLNNVALKNMPLPGAGSIGNLEKLAPSPAPTNAPGASSNAVDVKKDQAKDKADETSEKPTSANSDFNETEAPSGAPSSAPAPAPAPGSNPANPSGTPRNNAGLAATGTVGQPAAGPPAPPSTAPAPAPAPTPSSEEVTRPADNGNAGKKTPAVIDLAPTKNSETNKDVVELKPMRAIQADEKLTLSFSPDGKLKINDPLAARENARDLSGANGPTAKTLATAAATAKELQTTRNGIDAVQKEAAGISRVMGEKVTAKQDEIKKLEAALDEEAKKGPISKERADYYRKEVSRIRADVSTILSPNTDSIGETANRQWDIQQRFAETQQQVLEESQRMLLRDQESGNLKTFLGDYLRDGGAKLSDKGYNPFGQRDIFTPLDPFQDLLEKRTPFQRVESYGTRDRVNPLAPFLPKDPRGENEGFLKERGQLRPELKLKELLAGSAKIEFPGLKPREVRSDRFGLKDLGGEFGGFKLNSVESDPSVLRIPLRSDNPTSTAKLDRSLFMSPRGSVQLQTDFSEAGKLAHTLDIKEAYDAKLSPEGKRALRYASDVLKQPVSLANWLTLERTVDAEKGFIRSKATTLENATNPMLDRLNAKIDLAQTQGLAGFQALESFGGDAARFREKGVGAYRDEMGRAQKDIDAAKTIETEFHSKETPSKVIPDDKVEGVRKQFQERVLAGDKASDNPAFMTAYADQVRQAKERYGEKFVTDLQQIVAKGGGEKEIAALFKDKPNAAGDILYATTLAGSMGKILDVDKARLNMVVGQASQVVSQSEFKTERNRMLVDKPSEFLMRMSKDSTPISDVMSKVLKHFEDQGIMTKMGMGLAVLGDAGIQKDPSFTAFDVVSGYLGGPQIRPSLKFTTLADLNDMVKKDLMPLSDKMHQQHSTIFDMWKLGKDGKLGGSGQISREEAERRAGAAWEEHLKLRGEAHEKVQKYAEYAEKTLQNGKLAKDLYLAGATLALAIPTGGQSLWALGGIGAAVKGTSTALDTATSAKGFDWKATTLDAGIGFLEMAAGGGVGKLGSFTSNTILKTSGATLGRRVLAFGAEVGINAGGSAGVATFEPLIKSAAEGKPINPEELKHRALFAGLFGGGITAGLRAPVLVRGNPNLTPKVGVGDKPDGPPVATTAEIDPKTGMPVKKPDAQPQPVRPEEPVTPAGTNKDPVQPVRRVEVDEPSAGAARVRANEDFKYNMPADQAEKMVKDQAKAMGFDPDKVKVTISDNPADTAVTKMGKDGTVEVVLPKDANGKVRVNELFHESSQIKTYQTAGTKTKETLSREIKAQEEKLTHQAKNLKDKELELQKKLDNKTLTDAERQAAEQNLAKNRAGHEDSVRQMDVLQAQLKARELIEKAEVAASKLNDARQTAQQELKAKGRISPETQKAVDEAEAAYRATDLEQIAFQAEHAKMKDYIADVWEKGAFGMKPDGTPRMGKPEDFDGKTGTISKQVERAEMLASPEKRSAAITGKLYGPDAPKTLKEAEDQLIRMGFNKNDPDLRKALEVKYPPAKDTGNATLETKGVRLEKPAAEKKLEEMGGERMSIAERDGYKGMKDNVYKLPEEEAKRIKEAIMSDPNVPQDIKDVIGAYSHKNLRFTFDLDGHGSPGSGQTPTTYKIFGLDGKDANRLGSFDSNFKFARK